MKLKLDRIISIATLFAALLAIFLVLKRPTPVVVQAPAAIAAPAPAQSSGQPMEQREQAAQQASPVSSGSYVAAPAQIQTPSQNQPAVATSPQPKAQSHSSADGISALLAQAAQSAGGGELSPDSEIGDGEPNIKDQQVTYEGDVVHGRFLTEIAGKDVWVTISGHMGSKDGYATFDPTEFKVGDVSVPVSLINPSLQRKLAEQREKLKLPE
ncbi:MAG: hypothetical protein ABSF72_08635 [Candidatus Sulfotelmatobacter sp.]|jgi:hypothetical protein